MTLLLPKSLTGSFGGNCLTVGPMKTSTSQAKRFQAFHGLPMTLDPPPVSPWHGSVHRQSTDTSSYSQLKVKVSSRWHLHTSLDMSTVVAKTKSCKLFMQICQVKPRIKAIWKLIQNKSCPFQWQEANISTPGSSHMLEFASLWVRMSDKQKYIRNIFTDSKRSKVKSVPHDNCPHHRNFCIHNSPPRMQSLGNSCFFVLHALDAFCRKSSLSVGSAHFQHFPRH